jgi:hypothetical protein
VIGTCWRVKRSSRDARSLRGSRIRAPRACFGGRTDVRRGDRRGTRAPAVYVAESQPYLYLDLRVDERPDPGAELRRIYEVAKVELLPFIEALPARKNPKGGFGGRSGAP